ncbi:serine palmitoyltransferase 1 [[Candida] jaroonii]|uniref:Serine palmitoyltransferase 1 n=1 Tax=[Candida] jaroonii TaxID=467808 RepID=A0ACA9Y646_9ASCO|nr:serine palmitoyltransferase 1 [[Candida] jaroonii]
MSESEYIFTTTKTTTAIATTTLPPTLDSITSTLSDTFVHYLNYLGKLPGGDYLLWYIKASYKDDPIRSLFELMLFIFGVRYFLMSKRKENKSELVKFSQREIDELIDDWNPTELVEPVNDTEDWQLKSIPQIEGPNGPKVKLMNLTKGENVLNFAINDFLNLSRNETIRHKAKDIISTTGVGACSAPNFYGTQEVHVRLEEDISSFMHTDNSIIYGQDFITSTSVLPAFVKRGDLCVVDSGVNLAIQKALVVSRCDISWYNHNDMNHLESVLKELKPGLDKQKQIQRRFIVTEGIFDNTGELVNLPELVKLKNQYKYRVFLDETNSIGVLGDFGRGVTEHFGIDNKEIEIIVGSMAKSFGSSGGFCTGTKQMIHHQRLSSLAYVFSASLPPYSAKVTSTAIEEILHQKNGKSIIVSQLQHLISYTFKNLLTHLKSSPFIEIVNDSSSPTIHLALKNEYRESIGLPQYYGNVEFVRTGKRAKFNNELDEHYLLENFILQKIIDEVLKSKNILLTRSKALLEHENLPIRRPRLLVLVNIGLTENDVDSLITGFNDIINDICTSIKTPNDLTTLRNEMINY